MKKFDLFQTPVPQPATNVGLIFSFLVLPACVCVFTTYSIIQLVTETVESSSIVATQDQCAPLTFRCTAPSCNISSIGTGNAVPRHSPITLYQYEETAVEMCAGTDSAIDITQSLTQALPADLVGTSSPLAASDTWVYFSYGSLLTRLSLLDLKTTESITMNDNEQNFTSAAVYSDGQYIIFVSPDFLVKVSVQPSFARVWSIAAPDDAQFQSFKYDVTRSDYGYVLMTASSAGGSDPRYLISPVLLSDIQSPPLLDTTSRLTFTFGGLSIPSSFYQEYATLQVGADACYVVNSGMGISKFDINTFEWKASVSVSAMADPWTATEARAMLGSGSDENIYLVTTRYLYKYRTSTLTFVGSFSQNAFLNGATFDDTKEFAYLLLSGGGLTQSVVKVRLSDLVIDTTFTTTDHPMIPSTGVNFDMLVSMNSLFVIDASTRHLSRSVYNNRTIGEFVDSKGTAMVPATTEQTYSFMATKNIDRSEHVSYIFTYTAANTPKFVDVPCASNANQLCYRYNLGPLMIQVVEKSVGSWISVLGSISGMASVIFGVLKMIVPRLTRTRGNTAERVKTDCDILTQRELQSGIHMRRPVGMIGGRSRVAGLHGDANSSSHLFNSYSHLGSPAEVGLEVDRFSPKRRHPEDTRSMLSLELPTVTVTVAGDNEEAEENEL
eukprot:GILK01010926.1.p1 GENE.GILK01010926.1~~GILK01010926.1.p1  ORF type:complete len:667 (-),score=41.97 GILK01010926.1:75-2075(-)